MAVKYSISGIRGKYNELSPERVIKLSHHFADYNGRGKIAVCYDGRPSSNFLLHAVSSGLRGGGSSVVNFGNIPTPLLQWIMKDGDFTGGISISGGHNSFDWNSLILLNASGSYINNLEGDEFFSLVHSGDIDKNSYSGFGAYSTGKIEIDDYFRVLKPDKPLKSNRKFVVDCSMGFGTNIIQSLGDALKVKLIPVFCSDNAGGLPVSPEPSISNAAILGTLVKETGSSGGFLLNSDASRVLIVDERGVPFSEELTLPLFASILLKKSPTDIVTNYSTSKLINRVAAESGVKVLRTDVGQPYVIQAARETGAMICGEGSGSVSYSPFSYGFDSLYFIKRCVEELVCGNILLSEMAEGIGKPEIFKKTVYLPQEKIYKSLARVGKKYHNAVRLKDGFYIESGDDWICVRASSTASMIRVVAEGADSIRELDALMELVK